MKIRKLHPLFLLFLTFAAVGLFQLILRPIELLSTLLLFAIVILIFVTIYRYLIKKQHSKSTGNAHISMPKLFTSQKRKSSSTPIKKGKLKQKKKRTSNHPFTVIEGNKEKKKKPHSSS